MTKTPPYKTHDLLDHSSVSHGFFGREGGISTEQYASLNAGEGSHDNPENVVENRTRIASAIGTSSKRLLSNHQVHSAKVVIVDRPWDGEKPHADGLVTKTKGLALSALGADCGPVLFHDPDAAIIGACHAGWGGALKGITSATIKAMESLGATRGNIRAVLGPCISQANYEVGHDFKDMFAAERESYDRFFKLGPPKKDGQRKPHFDLKRFILARLRDDGITRIDALLDCTYGQPEDYFSYRYNSHNEIIDYGRNISAIMLKQ
ncbi:MAG: peptidoglycan editing factor PgeF [Hellea sp.]|nr:peptidoglycan editing factor PgeF [Hellea sp.]